MRLFTSLLTALNILVTLAEGNPVAACPGPVVKGKGFSVDYYNYPLEGQAGFNPDGSINVDFYKHGYKSQGGKFGTVTGVTDIQFYERYPTTKIWAVGNIYGETTLISDFTLVYTGFYKAPMTGKYTFHLAADDDISLQLGRGDACCGDFDDIVSDQIEIGTYGESFEQGTTHSSPTLRTTNYTVSFTKGLYYPIRMVYFNSVGSHVLKASIDRPDGSKTTNFGDVYQLDTELNCPSMTTQAWTGTFTTDQTKTSTGQSTITEIVVKSPFTSGNVSTTIPWSGASTTTTTVTAFYTATVAETTRTDVVTSLIVQTPTSEMKPVVHSVVETFSFHDNSTQVTTAAHHSTTLTTTETYTATSGSLTETGTVTLTIVDPTTLSKSSPITTSEKAIEFSSSVPASSRTSTRRSSSSAQLMRSTLDSTMPVASATHFGSSKLVPSGETEKAATSARNTTTVATGEPAGSVATAETAVTGIPKATAATVDTTDTAATVAAVATTITGATTETVATGETAEKATTSRTAGTVATGEIAATEEARTTPATVATGANTESAATGPTAATPATGETAGTPATGANAASAEVGANTATVANGSTEETAATGETAATAVIGTNTATGVTTGTENREIAATGATKPATAARKTAATAPTANLVNSMDTSGTVSTVRSTVASTSVGVAESTPTAGTQGVAGIGTTTGISVASRITAPTSVRYSHVPSPVQNEVSSMANRVRASLSTLPTGEEQAATQSTARALISKSAAATAASESGLAAAVSSSKMSGDSVMSYAPHDTNKKTWSHFATLDLSSSSRQVVISRVSQSAETGLPESTSLIDTTAIDYRRTSFQSTVSYPNWNQPTWVTGQIAPRVSSTWNELQKSLSYSQALSNNTHSTEFVVPQHSVPGKARLSAPSAMTTGESRSPIESTTAILILRSTSTTPSRTDARDYSTSSTTRLDKISDSARSVTLDTSPSPTKSAAISCESVASGGTRSSLHSGPGEGDLETSGDSAARSTSSTVTGALGSIAYSGQGPSEAIMTAPRSVPGSGGFMVISSSSDHKPTSTFSFTFSQVVSTGSVSGGSASSEHSHSSSSGSAEGGVQGSSGASLSGSSDSNSSADRGEPAASSGATSNAERGPASSGVGGNSSSGEAGISSGSRGEQDGETTSDSEASGNEDSGFAGKGSSTNDGVDGGLSSSSSEPGSAAHETSGFEGQNQSWGLSKAGGSSSTVPLVSSSGIRGSSNSGTSSFSGSATDIGIGIGIGSSSRKADIPTPLTPSAAAAASKTTGASEFSTETAAASSSNEVHSVNAASHHSIAAGASILVLFTLMF